MKSTCIAILLISPSQGVSGTGKSTIGRQLSEKLALPFIEGDDLHPRANIDKMSAGEPLNDQDRAPWLLTVRRAAVERASETQKDESRGNTHSGGGAVVTCSALKVKYREVLRGTKEKLAKSDDEEGDDNTASTTRDEDAPHPDEHPLPHARPPQLSEEAAAMPIQTYFIFLRGSKALLTERMKERKGHFMKVSMLESQLDTLEDPEYEENVVTVSLDDLDKEGKPRTLEEVLEDAWTGLHRLGAC
jgi:gluconokinase